MTLDERVASGSACASHARSAGEWALIYARLGWRAFPVVAGEKRPAYRGWQRDATTAPQQIARFWRRVPGPNIGVVCGEAFDAFDIEAEHLATFRHWADGRGYRLPVTPLARTGRGGIHLLVAPTGIARGHNLVLDGVHIGELKSAGGFIVACPSVTVGPYRWLRPPDACPVTSAPDWLVRLVAQPQSPPRLEATRPSDPCRVGRQLAALSSAVAGAGPGSRNKLLYWAMRRALDEGLGGPDAARALAAAATAAGLGEREVRATLRSALIGARR